MTPFEAKLLASARNSLRTLGIEYLLRLPDGTQIESENWPKAEEPKAARKRTRKYQTGVLHAAYLPKLEKLQPSEPAAVIDIPEGVHPRDLQGAIAAWCSKHWGSRASHNGVPSYITELSMDERQITVARML